MMEERKTFNMFISSCNCVFVCVHSNWPIKTFYMHFPIVASNSVNECVNAWKISGFQSHSPQEK